MGRQREAERYMMDYLQFELSPITGESELLTQEGAGTPVLTHKM
jgi:hypothetical protein